MARLKQIALRLPRELIEAIDEVVKAGRYANRSEFIRDAIREKLEREAVKSGSEVRGGDSK